jgi:hypothetical protein
MNQHIGRCGCLLADRWWEWHQGDSVAFADDPQDAVAVFFADVGDVRSGCLADTQAWQSEHGEQREVVEVRGLTGGTGEFPATSAGTARHRPARLPAAGDHGRRTSA